MSLSKFLDPKNDFAFKKIFGTEKNQDILIHFINDMLGFEGEAKIATIQFLKTNQDPDIASKKQSILDVLCTDQQGRQYIVEMQMAKTTGFVKRAQYYAARAYSSQLNESEDYHNLKEIIFLAITNFVMFPGKKAYKSRHILQDDVTSSHDLQDFSFIFLELPKFNKKIDQLDNMIEKWAYFFKHAAHTSEQDLRRIAGSDPIIERAYEALNQFSWSEIEMNTYEAEEKRLRDERSVLKQSREEGIEIGREEGRKEGRKKGREEGIEIGREEGIYVVAKKMLAAGFDIDVISNCTGRTAEEIQAIKNSLEDT